MPETKNSIPESPEVTGGELSLEEIAIDDKIQSLSNINTATIGVQDINIKNDMGSIEGVVGKLDGEGAQPQISEEQLKGMLLDKIRSLDPDQRNKIIKEIASLQQVNPKNRSFSSINENKRQALLQRLHEKRDQLGMKRKSKQVLQGIQRDLIEKYEQMQSQLPNTRLEDSGDPSENNSKQEQGSQSGVQVAPENDNSETPESQVKSQKNERGNKGRMSRRR